MFPKYKNIFKNKEIFRSADKFYENSFKMPIWYEESDIKIVLKYCEALKKVTKFYKKGEKENEIL